MEFAQGSSIIVQGDQGEDMFILDAGEAAAKIKISQQVWGAVLKA